MITETYEIETQEEKIKRLNAKPGIFKELENNKICFAILSYKNKLRFEPSVKEEKYVKKLKYNEGTDKVLMKNVKSISYEILILEKDAKDTSFPELDSDKHKDVVSHEIGEHEIYYFKKNIKNFIKVVNNDDGAVFELKGNSFKTYREKELNKMKPAARKMVNKFHQPLKKLKCSLSENEISKYSKARAVKIIKHFMQQMPEGSENWLYNRKLLNAINNLE